MKVVQAFVGARLIDSEPYSHMGDIKHAQALKDAGIDGVISYLGPTTKQMVENVISVGLGWMPCTYADKFDGNVAIIELAKLGIPIGCTCWLDIEGPSIIEPNMNFAVLLKYADTWSNQLIGANYTTGGYFGSPQPLTSKEMFYDISFTHYWKGQSRVEDRFNNLAEPDCGWCMTQMWDSVDWMNTGVWSDINIIGRDFHKRLPNWVVKD